MRSTSTDVVSITGGSSPLLPEAPSVVSTVSPDSSLRLARDPRLSIPAVGDGLGERAEVAVVLKDSEAPLEIR